MALAASLFHQEDIREDIEEGGGMKSARKTHEVLIRGAKSGQGGLEEECLWMVGHRAMMATVVSHIRSTGTPSRQPSQPSCLR